ncbi:PAS domain-containing protein [Candidatus Saccharibacteria bacterium CPR2]|nr:PAS domain-containing protein [Candidatus Saccharibacteria bacterium CPR2]
MQKDLIRQLRAHISWVMFLSYGIVAASGTLTWLLLNIYFDISIEITSIIAFGVSTFVGSILVYFLQTFIIEPIDVLTKVIANILAPEESAQTLTIKGTLLGRELIEKLTDNIYKLVKSKEAESQTSNSNARYIESILNKLPVAVMILDNNQSLAFANKEALEFIGSEQSESIGVPFERIVNLDFQGEGDYKSWLESSRQNKVHDKRIWNRVKLSSKNQVRYIDLVAHYSKNDSLNQEVVLVFTDKTGSYSEDENQLSFVALAAHELRGPITVIRGYLDVLSDELNSVANDEQKGLLSKVVLSANQLATYVNNILNVSRVDQNELKLFIKEEDIISTTKETVDEIGLRATALNRKIILKSPQNLPTVAIDKVGITEVLNNLVDNAIKYSYEGGEIVVELRQRGDQVEVIVQDRGIGIPSSVIGNLFKKFYRSHRTKGAVGGTGLGLYLSKAIIDAHGGQIYVSSKEGEGSTFGFLVPTFASVANKLEQPEKGIVRSSHGWIKNHAMYRK